MVQSGSWSIEVKALTFGVQVGLGVWHLSEHVEDTLVPPKGIIEESPEVIGQAESV